VCTDAPSVHTAVPLPGRGFFFAMDNASDETNPYSDRLGDASGK
jgi:hypothetical protein